jgi:hypothetical protein
MKQYFHAYARIHSYPHIYTQIFMQTHTHTHSGGVGVSHTWSNTSMLMHTYIHTHSYMYTHTHTYTHSGGVGAWHTWSNTSMLTVSITFLVSKYTLAHTYRWNDISMLMHAYIHSHSYMYTHTHTHIHSGGVGAWHTWSSISMLTVSITFLVSSACGRSPR